ncbi:MAG: alpha/beta hydrolase [Clostridia bacterium]|nr:alpha/beta hydrolase [Clostridia bacterium]
MTGEERARLVEMAKPVVPSGDELSAAYRSRGAGVETEERFLATWAGRTHIYLYFPKVRKARMPLLVNIHGGGFVGPHLERDTLFCRAMTAELSCVTLDIDYRTTREAPFPSALHECCGAVEWAVEHSETLGIDPQKIAVGGQSAGGNLTNGVSLLLKERGKAEVRLQILSYPSLDLTGDPLKMEQADPAFPPKRMYAYNTLYVEHPEERGDPLVSPLRADGEVLKKLPDTVLVIGEKDIFREENERYAAMLLHAGVKVTAKCFPASAHGFVTKCTGAWEESHAMMTGALKEVFER